MLNGNVEETDLLTFARIIEEIARADGSTAWCLVQASGCSLVSAFLEPAVASEIFGPRARGILAWGPGRGRAIAVDGGYRLTGQWSFASGCHHATWLGGIATIVESDGTPRRDERGAAEIRTLLFPKDRARFEDVWQVSGLRGTGSDTFAVSELFVPEAFNVRRDDPGERREPGRLYAFHLNNVFALGFASVALGIARGTLDALVELARAKTPRAATGVLRDDPVVRSEVARAEANWRSGRAFLRETVAEAWETASSSEELPLPQRIQIRLAATHAIHLAAQALDVAYHHAGATAIFEQNPFERRFRDLHAVTQQVQGRYTHYENVGRHLLGIDPDPAFL
ncbi:MAG TPA: acyl-CoA dehydrogenase family protein [Chloroflexota bacterium]|nr:acyl-CoA dehydrogenase family protein [Chloroflexota bacterium]